MKALDAYGINKDIRQLYAFCETQCESVDQNWQTETTTYTFDDGSQVVLMSYPEEPIFIASQVSDNA